MFRALSLVCLLISWTVARQTSALCGRGQSCRSSKLEALSIGQCSRYEADDRPRPGPDIPDYVLKHAPLWRFHSQERAWPMRLDDYLEKVPRILGSDRKPVKGAPDRPTLDNLNDPSLNDRTVFLTSRGDVTRFPKWIWNEEGKPVNGRSSAPSIIILVDHGDGVLDTFTFMFCAFNMGPYVREMGTNMGHHLSEWEHVMTRFVHGSPTAVWLSLHGRGRAYTWAAMEKEGSRPIVYAALGTHGNYATRGKHPIFQHYVADYTDAGTTWDPALNYEAWWHSEPDGPLFTPTRDTTLPTNWLYSFVRWGDMAKSEKHPRQKLMMGQAKWANGTFGPIDKFLVRKYAHGGIGPDDTFGIATELPDIEEGKPGTILSK